MTITFQYDNDIIVYALEKVISFTTDNQPISLAWFVWSIAAVVGLQSDFVNYIDNFDERARKRISGNKPSTSNVHSGRDSLGLYDREMPITRSDLVEDQSADRIIHRGERFIDKSENTRDQLILGRVNPLPPTKRQLKKAWNVK
jgi:hypothetical protein